MSPGSKVELRPGRIYFDVLGSEKINQDVVTLKKTKNKYLTNSVKEAIRNNKFPDSLKLSDIKPVYKKLDSCDKANYRPVSVLPFKYFKELFITSFMNI